MFIHAVNDLFGLRATRQANTKVELAQAIRELQLEWWVMMSNFRFPARELF